VYATHPYNQPNKQYRNWEDSFGALVKVAPVMATEFGDLKDCSPDYTKSFLDYAETKGIHWTAWAWFVGGCSFPSLITDWEGTPSAPGAAVKKVLARL
jgi:endoglucanase